MNIKISLSWLLLLLLECQLTFIKVFLYKFYHFIIYNLPLIVGRRIKTVAYAGLFGGVLTGLGGILYTLYTEISETSGSYGMIQKAVSRLESDQKV